jgi:hypothetical protein
VTPVAEPTEAPDSEVLPEPQTDSPYGDRNQQLPEQLKKAIRSAIIKSQGEERYLRRLEVLHDRKLRFYERGHQHIYEGKDDCFMLAVPGGTFTDADGNEEEWGDYIDDYPIFHGFIWIIQSVLTQNGPGIAFEAIDPSLSEDSQAAETADGLRRHFDRVNDVKSIMRQIVRMFCLSGRVVTWVKTEENAAKWGRGDDGQPRKNQVACVYGSLESKVPIMEKEQCNFPYLILYNDLDVRNARQNHPWIRDKIKANEPCLDENNYERFARLGILQGARSQFQAGEAIAHMVTEGHAWLRPSCWSDQEFDEPFDEADEGDVDEDGNTITVRDKLAQVFADKQGGFTGLHAVYVGDTYSMSWPESMDDCTQCEQPFAGDGQFALAVMDPAVVAQDRFNTLMNYCAEVFDFGAPSTWVFASKVDFESYADQRAQVYGIRQLKAMAPSTNSVEDNFFREPDPDVPATLNQLVQFLFGEFLQFVLACPPAMWGESSEDTKTASGLAQSRNQALGRMGIIWAVLQKVMARLYYQVALAASNDPDTPEEIIVPVKGSQNITVRVERLRKGHFMATPDEDSGFPDSTAAKRATLMNVVQLVAQFPPAAQQFFAAPANWKELLKLFGISEMVIPEAESHDKQTEEIEELLNGVPIEPTPEEIQQAQLQHDQMAAMAAQHAQLATAAGMPPSFPVPPFDPASLIHSSVPIKPWDFDEWEMQACDDYLNSDAARIEEKVGRADPATGQLTPNIRGIQNVWLHRQEHAKAAAMKMPPVPPVPPVAPKKPGGAPGAPGGPKPPVPASQPAGSPGTATI